MSDSSHLPRLVRSDGLEFVLTDKMIVGRLPECKIEVKDDLASRRHAMLEVVDQGVVLTDLGSNNGTWVNDQKITKPVDLRDGDRVRIGETAFVFKSPDPQPQETAIQFPNAPKEKGGSATNQTMVWQTAALMTLVRGNDGAEFGLNSNMRIGRDEANDLSLKGDVSASQFHAVIELLDGRAAISDLNSSNGTWVNGKRIAGKTFLRHGDKIHLGKTVFRLRVGNSPLPPLDAAVVAPQQKSSMWIGWAAIVFLIGIALIIVCVAAIPAIIALTNYAAPTATTQPSATLAAVVETPDIAKAKQGALKSLTMIVVPDENSKTNDTYYSGSGSFVNSEGYILTNFHVVGYTESEAKEAGKNTGDLINDLYDGEELILAGVNWSNPLASPDTFYRCEIVKTDPGLDLAVLRVVELYNSDSETFEPLPVDLSFPVISIGNSDDLKLLEPITIIGFPGVGGDTPTAIDDQVAGFSPDENFNLEKGWIKTGPVISHGNSGGMAINQRGELIGIPTAVIIFQADKIGYIRPINLALPLIQEFLP